MLEGKQKADKDETLVIRLEQLYPLHKKALEDIVKQYPDAEKYWVQEEPANMGAWIYIQSKMPEFQLKVISRKTSASPATGFKKLHDEQQAKIVADALAT